MLLRFFRVVNWCVITAELQLSSHCMAGQIQVGKKCKTKSPKIFYYIGNHLKTIWCRKCYFWQKSSTNLKLTATSNITGNNLQRMNSKKHLIPQQSRLWDRKFSISNSMISIEIVICIHMIWDNFRSSEWSMGVNILANAHALIVILQ